MPTNNTFSAIWDVLQSCKNIAMTLHISPDGDSLGSCAALKYVLEKYLDCKVRLVSIDPLDRILMKFPFAQEVEFGIDISDLEAEKYDAFIFLDFSSRNRLSSKLKEHYRLPSTLIINIDHHQSNEYFGGLNYVDTREPSTCSVLLEFFKALEIPFDRELSNRLLLGICTDSNFFSYSDNALMDAAFLVNHGGDYTGLMIDKLRMSTPLNVKKYHALLVANLKDEGQFAYSTVNQAQIQALNLNPAEVRLGIAAIEDVEEYEFVFLLAEFKTHIKGSFRSRDNVDVSLFAIRLGGGGHRSNAGFTLEPMSMKEAVAKVLSVIESVGIQYY